MKTSNNFIQSNIPNTFIILTVVIFLFSSCKKDNTSKNIASAEKLFGLEFNQAERDSMVDNINTLIKNYENIRSYPINNTVPPALYFNPVPHHFKFNTTQEKINWNLPQNISLPENNNDIAYFTIAELAFLIKTKKITSTQLTNIYLARLKKYKDTLKCVVTLTEELAIKQAKKADEEIAQGSYRGPLHGIPYGVKDLLAIKGYKTTWGANPYKDQYIEETATVVKKLEKAGAVLVAKLSMGALAWGDVWFGGVTKNPWNLNQGSSGSSAGSASATAAGLVAFSIGTETWGSIVSPSTRCGTSGLRPTYGRVSRAHAMALSWSMDKIGPICRSAEDCALVFNAIRGADGIDQTIVDLPFNYEPNIRLKDIRIGYFRNLFEKDYENKTNDSISLEVLKTLGAELIPTSIPDSIPVESLELILSAEAAAAFDELTRSNEDDKLVRQIKNAWPNVFRQARFIPAVEYIQANRLRYLLIQEMNKIMQKYDVIVSPSFGGNQLLLTNLTGHPCVVIPNGFNKEGSPTSITFLGNLYDEATILSIARVYQNNTDFDEQHPPFFSEH